MIIKINNMRLPVVIGVYDWEKQNPQLIRADIELEFDGSSAGISDDVGDTIDYATLAWRIEAKAGEGSYNLLETLAEKILDVILDDDRVLSATVALEKAGAIASAQSVSVVASRCADE